MDGRESNELEGSLTDKIKTWWKRQATYSCTRRAYNGNGTGGDRWSDVTSYERMQCVFGTQNLMQIEADSVASYEPCD